jgi:hypothetical protein
MNFDQCQICGWSANIPWVVDFVAPNSDLSLLPFSFIWFQFADKLGVDNILPSVLWHLMHVNKKYSVCALDSTSDTLGKSSKLVGRQGHPHFTVSWVSY